MHVSVYSSPLCAASYNQFHQYYINGKFSDCREEKALMSNCLKWKAGSERAKVRLLNFRGHRNAIWIHILSAVTK